MPLSLKPIPLLCCLTSAAGAEGIDVQFQDGNPVDRFVIFNRGCPIVEATFTLDFSNSAGKIVIDTRYGGLGTRDPSDVVLTEGDATLRPVRDGDRMLELTNVTLPNLGAVTVTMDVDDTTALFEDTRVVADGRDVAGTQVTLSVNETRSTVTLDQTGRGQIKVPPSANACALS